MGDMAPVKETIYDYIKENPNTSPLTIIHRLAGQLPDGIAAGAICVMREGDESLIVTGEDSNGVLLSVSTK